MKVVRLRQRRLVVELYVAVAGVGACGLCAEGDNPVVLGHSLQRLRYVGLELVAVEDGVVGGRDDERRLGVYLADHRRGIGYAGGCVAAQRLGKDLVGQQVGQLLAHASHVLLAGDDDDVLLRAYLCVALEGELQHGASHAGDVDKLLGVVGAALWY